MKKWLFLIPASLPCVTFAHGGHGIFDPNTLIHYFGTPEHGLPIAGVVILTVFLLYRRRKRAERLD